MIHLVNVSDEPRAAAVLYMLLAERPMQNWISHREMPSPSEHKAFVNAHPFRYWYLIEAQSGYVGAIECTNANEIGVAIRKAHQRRGYARAALRLFLATHEPLPAIPAVRNGNWLANIATMNIGSKQFFADMGFKALQETWALPYVAHDHDVGNDEFSRTVA